MSRLNANDERYLIVDWLVDDGETVEPGTLILSVETSKAVEDIESPVGGVVDRRVAVGQECAVGDVLAYLSPVPEPDR